MCAVRNYRVNYKEILSLKIERKLQSLKRDNFAVRCTHIYKVGMETEEENIAEDIN